MILTSKGRQKVADAIANGTDIDLATVAVGDGSGTPTEAQTALESQQYSATADAVYRDTTNTEWVVVELTIPATEGGWYVREVGIFDTGGDLFAIGKFPDTYKPVMTEGSGKELLIKVIFEVSNTADVNMTIDPSLTTASREYVESRLFGAILPWDEDKTYFQGEYCIGSDNRVYRSRTAANLDNDPTAAGWVDSWELQTRDYVTEAAATISSGTVQVYGFFNDILPEGGAADTLNNIDIANIADGQYIIIRNADSTNTITVANEAGGPGQFVEPDGADLDLDDVAKMLICRREGTNILIVSKLGSAWGDQTGSGGSDDWYYGDASDGDLTVSTDTAISVATADADFLVSNYNDLTINAGVSLYPQRRVKCWVVYVAGDLVVNGHLHIDALGANAAASQLQIDRGVLITAAPYSDTGDSQVLTVPAVGGAGGRTNRPWVLCRQQRRDAGQRPRRRRFRRRYRRIWFRRRLWWSRGGGNRLLWRFGRRRRGPV